MMNRPVKYTYGLRVALEDHVGDDFYSRGSSFRSGSFKIMSCVKKTFVRCKDRTEFFFSFFFFAR